MRRSLEEGIQNYGMHTVLVSQTSILIGEKLNKSFKIFCRRTLFPHKQQNISNNKLYL